MTNAELLDLAVRSFTLMTAAERVITLTLFAERIKKNEIPLDAFINATLDVCRHG